MESAYEYDLVHLGCASMKGSWAAAVHTMSGSRTHEMSLDDEKIFKLG